MTSTGQSGRIAASPGYLAGAVAVLVALASSLVLIVIGGAVLSGVVALVIVIPIAALAGLLTSVALVLRRSRAHHPWATAIAITIVVLAIYVALAITGTQRVSVTALRPELIIALVSIAVGCATFILSRGRWRVLGYVGCLGCVLLVLTPVIVAV